jgi:hypothetical protein
MVVLNHLNGCLSYQLALSEYNDKGKIVSFSTPSVGEILPPFFSPCAVSLSCPDGSAGEPVSPHPATDH